MKKQSTAPADPSRKRILLVDDHPLMREGLAQWIRRAPELEICGEVASAAEALAAVQKLKPDLVLTDISLPGRNGIELIKDVRAHFPKLPVLVLSMHDEALYAGRALRAGARGYLMKRAGGERVVEGIRQALSGGMVLSPEMSTSILEQYCGQRQHPASAPLPQLTDREFEVLQLLGEAKTNREIAEELHLSPKTVETHRMNLLRKLKLKSAAEVMRFAIQLAAEEAGSSSGKSQVRTNRSATT